VKTWLLIAQKTDGTSDDYRFAEKPRLSGAPVEGAAAYVGRECVVEYGPERSLRPRAGNVYAGDEMEVVLVLAHLTSWWISSEELEAGGEGG
jgi:hypothetical protein